MDVLFLVGPALGAAFLCGIWARSWLSPKQGNTNTFPDRSTDQLLHAMGLLQKRAEAAEEISRNFNTVVTRQANAIQDLLRQVGVSQTRDGELEFYREQITHLQATIANSMTALQAVLSGNPRAAGPRPPMPGAPPDTFRTEPPDSSPTDTIRTDVNEDDPQPRRGETRINRPEPESLQGSQYREDDLIPPAS